MGKHNKILSQSGKSLSDVYNVEGSKVGVDELSSDEVHLVHEMGATILSERLSTRMVQVTTGDIAQTITFNTNFSFPENPFMRLLGVVVISSNDQRLSRVQVSITSPPAGQGMDAIVWGPWNTADGCKTANILLDSSLEIVEVLTVDAAVQPLLPNLIVGSQLPSSAIGGGAFTLTMRGVTATFGAGVVETQMLLYFAFPASLGLSSVGLPLPGW